MMSKCKTQVKKYPQQDEMTNDQLNNEYQNLSQERLDLLRGDSDNDRLDNVKKRMDYIDRISEYRETETTIHQ